MKSRLPILALMLMLLSCQQGTVVNELREFPDEQWKVADSLTFEFNLKEVDRAYDLSLSLRHTTDYIYSNLYLFAITTIPGPEIRQDTIEFILSRPDGKWIGKGFGRIRYNEFMIRKGMMFPDTGHYVFTFRHGMRSDPLEGIRSFGFHLEKTDIPVQPGS